MANAAEIDILPGVRGDLDEPLVSGPFSALGPILLPLVDRGWIEVYRLVPWTAPDGTCGEQPGPPIPKQDLPAVLADAENWEYPRSGTWLGCLTLTLTEAGRRVSRGRAVSFQLGDGISWADGERACAPRARC